MTEWEIADLIRVISLKMRIVADHELMRDWNVTFAQANLMMFLYDRGGAASQKEIEEHMQIKHPTASGLVRRLEMNRMLETRISEQDRRVKIVQLTDAASAQCEGMQAAAREKDRQLVYGLSPEEQEQLVTLLRKIYSNIWKNMRSSCEKTDRKGGRNRT